MIGTSNVAGSVWLSVFLVNSDEWSHLNEMREIILVFNLYIYIIFQTTSRPNKVPGKRIRLG